MQDYLIVIDMQKDFVDGALGSPEAVSIVPAVRQKILDHKGPVIFTRDTHDTDYLDTQEGRFLPVEHCIRDTAGWEIISELQDIASREDVMIVDKPSFGSTRLAELLKQKRDEIRHIELIGLCTDICVVSNALLIKAALPEVPVLVDSRCCAGVTTLKHESALETMRSCQVIVE